LHQSAHDKSGKFLFVFVDVHVAKYRGQDKPLFNKTEDLHVAVTFVFGTNPEHQLTL
jgi:hypothetical protein